MSSPGLPGSARCIPVAGPGDTRTLFHLVELDDIVPRPDTDEPWPAACGVVRRPLPAFPDDVAICRRCAVIVHALDGVKR